MQELWRLVAYLNLKRIFYVTGFGTSIMFFVHGCAVVFGASDNVDSIYRLDKGYEMNGMVSNTFVPCSFENFASPFISFIRLLIFLSPLLKAWRFFHSIPLPLSWIMICIVF